MQRGPQCGASATRTADARRQRGPHCKRPGDSGLESSPGTSGRLALKLTSRFLSPVRLGSCGTACPSAPCCGWGPLLQVQARKMHAWI